MTVAELSAELMTRDPEALIAIDREHKGWWALDSPYGIEDVWVVPGGIDYGSSVDESTEGAVRAVRIW